MGWPSKRQLRRWWRPFRVVAGFALVGVAAWVITGKTSELSGASAFLTQLRWYWLVLGGLAELGSFVALASVQRLLLRAGGVGGPPDPVDGHHVRRQLDPGRLAYRRGVRRPVRFQAVRAGRRGRGAGRLGRNRHVHGARLPPWPRWPVSAWPLPASTGSTFDLVGAILGVLVFATLVVVVWLKRAKAYEFLARAAAGIERRLHRPPGQFTGPMAIALERMSTVAPARDQWLTAVLAGGAYWIADCGCLAFAFLAVGSPVPWQGLLLAYCAAQLAVNLPDNSGRPWRRRGQPDSRSCRLRWRSSTRPLPPFCSTGCSASGSRSPLAPRATWPWLEGAGGESALDRRPPSPRRPHRR